MGPKYLVTILLLIEQDCGDISDKFTKVDISIIAIHNSVIMGMMNCGRFTNIRQRSITRKTLTSVPSVRKRLVRSGGSTTM